MNDEKYTKCIGECGEFFPSTTEYFHKNDKNKDGIMHCCKVCWNARAKKLRLDNKDEINRKRRKKYKENAELERAKSAKWKRDNPHYHPAWRRANPEKTAIYQQNRKHRNHNLTKSEWTSCKVYFNDSCAYCGMNEDEQRELNNEDFHQDHVIFDGVNGLSNCVPACTSCNTSKSRRSLDNWFGINNVNYQKKRLHKIMKWLNVDCFQYIKENKNDKVD